MQQNDGSEAVRGPRSDVRCFKPVDFDVAGSLGSSSSHAVVAAIVGLLFCRLIVGKRTTRKGGVGIVNTRT